MARLKFAPRADLVPIGIENFMALYSISPEQAKVLNAMRSEGLQIRKVLRIYPPLDIGCDQEILFVSSDGKAGTCFINTQGKVSHGPYAGFNG